MGNFWTKLRCWRLNWRKLIKACLKRVDSSGRKSGNCRKPRISSWRVRINYLNDDDEDDEVDEDDDDDDDDDGGDARLGSWE